MLGITLITVSQSNYKMKKLNSQGKKNFYIVEALAEEFDLNLHTYVGQTLDLAKNYTDQYENQLYDDPQIDPQDVYEILNHMFKELYQTEINKIEHNLGDINKYSIKNEDMYDVSLETSLTQDKITQDFDLSIVSSYQGKKIDEKIKVKYKIKVPEYKNASLDKELVKRVDWVNQKW